MTLKLTMQSTGPGRGLLLIDGHTEPAESVALGIRRNDGRYLGDDGAWQPTPHWHPQFTAEAAADGLRITLGPSLIDGIVAMQGQPLELTVRLDEFEDSGILRLRGRLVGSRAAADPNDTAGHRPVTMGKGDATATAPRPANLSSAQVDETAPLLDDFELDDSATKPIARKRRWGGLWLVGGVLVALLGIGAGSWYLGWLDALIGLEPGEPKQAEPQLESPFVPSPNSELTGRAFAVDFLGENPTGETIFAAAETRAEAGDCDAALILYARAADADPAVGADVARLYDPPSFAAGSCIDSANEDMALELYRSAAEAGVPEAMRRAGEILSARASSGPLYDEGQTWLRRSGAAP
jgi:hypothetical protein